MEQREEEMAEPLEREIHETFREGTPGTYIVHPDQMFSGSWNHKGESTRMKKILEYFTNHRTEGIDLASRFKGSVFKHFVTEHKYRKKFQGVVFRFLCFRMIYPDRPDELQFRIVGPNPQTRSKTCVFGRREFATVSGLRFGQLESGYGQTSMVFVEGCCLEKKLRSAITLKDVKNALKFHSLRTGVQNAEVLYRLGLVFFIYGYLLGWNENQSIPLDIFLMVEDLTFVERFAWGEYLWQITYEKIGDLMAQVMNLSLIPTHPNRPHKPNVLGWAPGLAYWAFDIFPRLEKTSPPFCTRLRLSEDAFPRMLRWECCKSTKRGSTMEKETMPEVGMNDHLVLVEDEVAKLVELGLLEDEIRALPRVFPAPPPQPAPKPMRKEPLPLPKSRRGKHDRGKKKVVTESSEGGEEESDDREEDDRVDDEEEAHMSGHEERGTGNVGRDTFVQHNPVLEATKQILVQLSEMRERMNAQEDEMRERMNAQEETLRTHGEMLNYLYQEVRNRQSGGMGNEHGFGLGHDGVSGRGHVVRRGRGLGHGVGGSGGNMRQTSTQSSDVLLDFNRDSLPENYLYTEQTTPQSATVQANPVEGQSSTPGMGWGFGSHFEGMDVAGQTIGEVEDLSRMFSCDAPPSLNTPVETLPTGALIAQSEIVMSPGTADVHRGKQKAGDIVDVQSDKRFCIRTAIKEPARIRDGSHTVMRKVGKWAVAKRFPSEMVTGFNTWYANPIPPKVKIPCGTVLDLVKDGEVGWDFFQRIYEPFKEMEQPQVDACIDLMMRQMDKHPENFEKNNALTYSDFAYYLGDAHIDQNSAIASLDFPEILRQVVNKWNEDTVVYMPWVIFTGHWAALKVDIPNWKITVYDCMLGEGEGFNDEVSLKIRGLGWSMRRVLEMDDKLKKLPPICFSESPKPLEVVVEEKEKVPQMPRPGDCGVYAVKHIEHMLHGESLESINHKNMEAIRRRLAIEVFNQCLEFYA